jgi:hypothetical protein
MSIQFAVASPALNLFNFNFHFKKEIANSEKKREGNDLASRQESIMNLFNYDKGGHEVNKLHSWASERLTSSEEAFLVKRLDLLGNYFKKENGVGTIPRVDSPSDPVDLFPRLRFGSDAVGSGGRNSKYRWNKRYMKKVESKFLNKSDVVGTCDCIYPGYRVCKTAVILVKDDKGILSIEEVGDTLKKLDSGDVKFSVSEIEDVGMSDIPAEVKVAESEGKLPLALRTFNFGNEGAVILSDPRKIVGKTEEEFLTYCPPQYSGQGMSRLAQIQNLQKTPIYRAGEGNEGASSSGESLIYCMAEFNKMSPDDMSDRGLISFNLGIFKFICNYSHLSDISVGIYPSSFNDQNKLRGLPLKEKLKFGVMKLFGQSKEGGLPSQNKIMEVVLKKSTVNSLIGLSRVDEEDPVGIIDYEKPVGDYYWHSMTLLNMLEKMENGYNCYLTHSERGFLLSGLDFFIEDNDENIFEINKRIMGDRICGQIKYLCDRFELKFKSAISTLKNPKCKLRPFELRNLCKRRFRVDLNYILSSNGYSPFIYVNRKIKPRMFIKSHVLFGQENVPILESKAVNLSLSKPGLPLPDFESCKKRADECRSAVEEIDREVAGCLKMETDPAFILLKKRGLLEGNLNDLRRMKNGALARISKMEKDIERACPVEFFEAEVKTFKDGSVVKEKMSYYDALNKIPSRFKTAGGGQSRASVEDSIKNKLLEAVDFRRIEKGCNGLIHSSFVKGYLREAKKDFIEVKRKKLVREMVELEGGLDPENHIFFEGTLAGLYRSKLNEFEGEMIKELERDGETGSFKSKMAKHGRIKKALDHAGSYINRRGMTLVEGMKVLRDNCHDEYVVLKNAGLWSKDKKITLFDCSRNTVNEKIKPLLGSYENYFSVLESDLSLKLDEAGGDLSSGQGLLDEGSALFAANSYLKNSKKSGWVNGHFVPDINSIMKEKVKEEREEAKRRGDEEKAKESLDCRGEVKNDFKRGKRRFNKKSCNKPESSEIKNLLSKIEKTSRKNDRKGVKQKLDRSQAMGIEFLSNSLKKNDELKCRVNERLKLAEDCLKSSFSKGIRNKISSSKNYNRNFESFIQNPNVVTEGALVFRAKLIKVLTDSDGEFKIDESIGLKVKSLFNDEFVKRLRELKERVVKFRDSQIEYIRERIKIFKD